MCVPNVQAADINGYLVLTTDYVFRGVRLSDSDPAAQLGADVEFDNGLYFGAWGSTIDISNGPGNQRDLELIYYAGYNHDVSDRWVVSANIVAYTYPGAEGIFDYDYVEYSACVHTADTELVPSVERRNYRRSLLGKLVQSDYQHSPDAQVHAILGAAKRILRGRVPRICRAGIIHAKAV